MMEKSALTGEGGGAPPPPFPLFTLIYKVAVYAPAQRAIHLYPICTLWSPLQTNFTTTPPPRLSESGLKLAGL
jgi:hypothetical protein